MDYKKEITDMFLNFCRKVRREGYDACIQDMKKENDLINGSGIYSLEDVQILKEAAYNKGLHDGYNKRRDEEDPIIRETTDRYMEDKFKESCSNNQYPERTAEKHRDQFDEEVEHFKNAISDMSKRGFDNLAAGTSMLKNMFDEFRDSQRK